ncbi:MAG: AraC family transcriptional regulator [Pseudomonadota bacterium]
MSMHAEILSKDMQRDQFRSIARDLFGNIRQRFLRTGDEDHVALKTVPLGTCQLTRIRAPAHGVLALNSAKKSYDCDAIKVLVQITGKSRLRHKGNQIELSSNSAVIYDPTQQYSLLNATRVDQIVLQAPRQLFDDRLLRRLMNPLFIPSDGADLSHTLTSFIRTSAKSANQMSPEMRSSLGQSLAVFTQGVVGEAFRADMIEHVNQGSLLLLRSRAKEYVSQNFTNIDLNIEAIARKMGCTPRYLHKSFQTDGQTLQKYILNTRLEFSRSLLLSPEVMGCTISELSFRAGFNSNAHFCRVFKQKYGVSPNEMRGRYRPA